MFGIPIPIVDRLLGIGETAADRLIPDKNKKQDEDHDERKDQIAATNAGQSAAWYTPRNLILLVVALPVGLQYGVKPVIEWVAAVIGHPMILPNIDVAAPLRILLGLLGLDLTS